MAAADSDGTAKRVRPGSSGDDLDVKRQRAGLTKEEQHELRLSDNDVRLLALDDKGVKKLRAVNVQQWSAAALIAGGLEGTIEDKHSDVGAVVSVLKQQRVTGAALVKLTVDKLMADGIPRGPAELLVSRLAPSPPLAEPDDRCKWLDEALSKEPCSWAADSVHEFETNILGDLSMSRKLVVRKCYVDMGQIAEDWVKARRSKTPIGLLVVTGTPGIGKSVFQAYMAARLAAGGLTIVVQCGAEWCSRRAGELAVNHGRTYPLELLKDAMTVLLADPLGGGNARPVEHRAAGGCTIVFTSPQQSNYDTAWKQGLVNATRLFMPTWSKEELIRHRLVVLPLLTDEEVAIAFHLLGGSLRWLVVLSQRKGADMRAAARLQVEKYVAAATYDDLLKACRTDAATIEDVTKTSGLSYVLQINTDDYEVPCVELLKSEVAVAVIREKLAQNGREGRAKFLNAAMDVPALGCLVGKLFQEEVLDKLTAKGMQHHTLECKPLPGPGEPWHQRVPNMKADIQTTAAKAQKTTFDPAFLYVPLSEGFPAADFFFVLRSDAHTTLVLLQTTKDTTHLCKIEAMRGQLKHSFTDDALNSIGAIKWVVLTPPTTAAKYTTAQPVMGSWGGEVAVVQYVAKCE